jgi:integrase
VTDQAMKDGIVKRGSTWSYVVRVRDAATGKKHAQWKGGFATQDDAKAARDDARVEARKGTSVARAKLTVAEYLEAWQKVWKTQVKPSTMASYAMHCRVYIVPRIGGERLQELTPAMVDGLYAALQSEAGLSASTTRRVAATLHIALAVAYKKKLVTRNVAAAGGVTLPKTDPEADDAEVMQVWTAAELAKFLDRVRDDRLFPMWRLAAWTGMRRGEVVGLTWRDVDLDEAVVRVQRGRVIVASGDVRESTPKTRKGRRNVDLDVVTFAALKAWKARQDSERKVWERTKAGTWPDHGLVFTLEDGTPLNPAHVSRWFNRHVKAAGKDVPRIRLHDLRHTHASLLLAAGVPVKVVSERLGHATPGFTMNVYQHVIPGQQRDHLQRVADAAEKKRPKLRVANA